MAKTLYALALDKEPHSWNEIIAVSNEVLDLSPFDDDGECFKEALSVSNDVVIIWRKKIDEDTYFAKKIFVSIESTY